MKSYLGHSAKLSSLAYEDRLLSCFLFIYLADGVLRYRCQLLAGEQSNTQHTNTELTCPLKFIHMSALKTYFSAYKKCISVELSLRNHVFQQRAEKQRVLDPVVSLSSLGELAHENEELMPIMIRCEVGRYSADFPRQTILLQSSVILLVLSHGLLHPSQAELSFIVQAPFFSVLKRFSDL